VKVFLSTLVILFIFTSQVLALDLDSRNLVNNIVKSIKEEPNNWIVRDSFLYYSNDISDIAKDTFPELNDKCLVYIAFSVLTEDHLYIVIKKPVELYLSDEDEMKLAKLIRQLMFNKLYHKFGCRIEEPKRTEPPSFQLDPKVPETKTELKHL
jgi:hypothetical protein